MQWTIPLIAQQADFIQRLQSGYPRHLLHCETEGQHSELTVISGERLNQLRKFCWEMVKKYRPNDPQIYFINNMKGKLGEEVVKARLTDLVTEVDYKKRLGGDGKIDFTLTSNQNIGIQVKVRQGSIHKARWSISKAEVEKNTALVCILIQEEVNEAQSEYNLVTVGFVPTDLIKLSGKCSFKIYELLYSGGLHSYLKKINPLQENELHPIVHQFYQGQEREYSKQDNKVVSKNENCFAKVADPNPNVNLQRINKVSKASGSLYRFLQNKKLSNGKVVTYPRVEGVRNRDNIEHWYWGYGYDEKTLRGWRHRSVPVPRFKVKEVRTAIVSNSSVPTIIELIKQSKSV